MNKVTDKEVEAAYHTLVETLHPTDQICFSPYGMRKALEAAAEVREVKDNEPK